jgi:hypothetical protein
MKINDVRVTFFPGVIAAMSLLLLSCDAPREQEEAQFRRIALERYEDKVAGGWLGQAIGVTLGEPTEFKWMGKIIPFDLEDWYRLKPMPKEFIDNAPGWEKMADMIAYLQPYYDDKKNFEKWMPEVVPDQDDLYVEFMFLHSIHERGTDVTAIERRIG